MRIFLTGACGVLGQAIRRLCEGEHQLMCMDIVDQIKHIGGIQASITDRQAVLRATEGCDAIIHTAAMHGTSYGKASNASFIKANVLGAEYLFSAMLEHDIKRMVISSTLEVLCGRMWNAYGTAVLDETLPARPDWIYPLTKLQVEQLGHFYTQNHGLEVVSLRYAYVRDVPVDQINIGLLARQVSAEDVANANLMSAVLPGLRDEVFCIGPDTPLTQADTNQALAGQTQAVLERYWPGCADFLRAVDIQPHPNHFWPVTRIDKAKVMLGWQPKITFASYLQSLGWVPQTKNNSAPIANSNQL